MVRRDFAVHPWCVLKNVHLAVGQHQWDPILAPPILVYSGDWDVHWYDLAYPFDAQVESLAGAEGASAERYGPGFRRPGAAQPLKEASSARAPESHRQRTLANGKRTLALGRSAGERGTQGPRAQGPKGPKGPKNHPNRCPLVFLSCPKRIDLLTCCFSHFGPFLVLAPKG